MEAFLKIAIILFFIELGSVDCLENEPRCYSRFDWEDQLLEKAIRTETKVQQYMEKLEAAIEEIRVHKKEFKEWEKAVESQAEEHRLSVEKQLIAFTGGLTAAQDTARKIGTVYNRWGRTTCPGNFSETLYNGFAAGSHYSHSGSSASMLCLPKDPDWDSGKYSDALNGATGYIFGTEYQDGQSRSDQLFGQNHFQQNVPCVVCDVSTRSAYVMIPGKTSCHDGWTFEYSGYLMTGKHDHKAASNYYCVDKDPEDLPHGTSNEDGYLLYFVESRCGALKCPPYVNGRECNALMAPSNCTGMEGKCTICFGTFIYLSQSQT